MIDTFTKWIEAEPVGWVTKEKTIKFLLSIILRFGVPHCYPRTMVHNLPPKSLRIYVKDML
jgi:hypothetical protein